VVRSIFRLELFVGMMLKLASCQSGMTQCGIILSLWTNKKLTLVKKNGTQIFDIKAPGLRSIYSVKKSGKGKKIKV